MVSKKKHELIEDLLDIFPRPISEFADKLNVSYCTAQRYLLNLVIEKKARMVKISGIRMYLKKTNKEIQYIKKKEISNPLLCNFE